MSESETLTAARIPTVYFIDDSATMREVIKIAFRKENIHVITCTDASSALAQFGEAAPDAVITDVIMPDKDGYEVCEFIKQHDQLAKIPVILMSGVVNRTVAERATAVRADDLIRKPFQPQDLITRVKNLLHPKTSASQTVSDTSNSDQHAARVLNNLFSATPTPFGAGTPPVPRAETPVFASAQRPSAPSAPASAMPSRPPAAPAAEIQKLRNEIRRLELLVKKLEAELQAEHQYCAALEAHFKLQQESE
ncbi:MAG: response regulator [Candidatus Acidiferrales bacterium]